MRSMRPRFAGRALGGALLSLAIVCGMGASSVGASPSAKDLGSITVGSKNFPESQLIASMYSQVLTKAGYDVSEKFNIGGTELAYKALQSGDIDVYPEYAATVLEYVNGGAGEATPDPIETVKKLNAETKDDQIVALTPSPAQDENAFVVTKATAKKLKLKKLSDLKGKASDLVLGAPPECETRPYCAVGLKDTYGIDFQDVRSLDTGGPVTVKAVEDGTVDVGLLFSSDGIIKSKGFVVLQDDKHLQAADNVVALVRKDRAKAPLRVALNKVDAALTTPKLIALNLKMSVTKDDPADVATAFLKKNDLL
jgi:osmoprotectant transport system substrate-binding protein